MLSFQNGFKQRGVRSSFGAGNNAVVMKMTPYSTVREGLHRISREKKKKELESWESFEWLKRKCSENLQEERNVHETKHGTLNVPPAAVLGVSLLPCDHWLSGLPCHPGLLHKGCDFPLFRGPPRALSRIGSLHFPP